VTKPIRARKAVILAAGAGRRLGHFTEAHPKPLLEINGTPILGNCLTRLKEAGVEEVVMVVGHFADQIKAFAGGDYAGLSIRYIESEKYATTNNIYSLWLARGELNDDILLVEADIFFDDKLLPALQAAGADNVAAVALFARGMDGAVVTRDADGFVTQLIEGKEQGPGFDYSAAYKTVNIYRFGRAYLQDEFVPLMNEAVRAGRVNDYYELLLKDMLANAKHKLYALDCTDIRWYEIDDHLDRAVAEYKFLPVEERKKFLSGQYGSYWRYGVVDHAYIYNPYFPTADFWKRLKADFEVVAKEYPAGQKSLAQAMATAFDLLPERLVVANGASELIKIVFGHGNATVAVSTPGFNEYENATGAANLVKVELKAPTFEFDADAFIAKMKQGRAHMAVVVSPNNPTSLAVPREKLLKLLSAMEAYGALMILDESFIEFTDNPENYSLADQVPKRRNLVIVKSLSKIYGIAGLRLGYLYTDNASIINTTRRALPIWNINGFAESFLRLLPRYRAEFAKSCRQVREDTVALYEMLAAIPGGHAYAPQANFVFWRLPDGINADTLVSRLFAEHHMLIKDCSEKTMREGEHYVRIAARTPEENRRLVIAIREIVG
jgi:histidinol-phosphate/aromatic aminotransferase/cobyric acid decarboxylase-like protein/choline kinase